MPGVGHTAEAAKVHVCAGIAGTASSQSTAPASSSLYGCLVELANLQLYLSERVRERDGAIWPATMLPESTLQDKGMEAGATATESAINI